MIDEVLEIWSEHEKKVLDSFSMIASENILSPLASKACSGDFNNRYFFDDPTLWGEDAFHGGKIVGRIQQEILLPLLKELAGAKFVNVKPLSGLNCMNAIFASYCKPNDLVLCLPDELGGHSSTAKVAKTFNLAVEYVPYLNQFDVDLDKLAVILKHKKPKLVYIDQCCLLFPVNISEIANLIKLNSPDTYLHVDTSHLNGLIFAKSVKNPLQENADSFGGSTHKTFPGPIKGYFATSDEKIFQNFKQVTNHLISHSHTGSMVALAIALIEFKFCGGADYICQMLKNAKKFASVLNEYDINVQGKNRGYTNTHQVWIDTLPYGAANKLSQFLYEAGIIVSCFPKLPGINHASIRVGLNQPTRYGLKEQEIEALANAFADVVVNKRINVAKKIILELRHKFHKPKYCYSENLLEKSKFFITQDEIFT
ncbi:MAG: serine hydroxymethyltransferase [Gammaproteobacteria bacterium]